MLRRIEPVLTAFFFANWIVALLSLFGAVDLEGAFPVGLYGLFSAAAAGGWVFGNLYVVRARKLSPWLRRGLLLIYFLGPMGLLLFVSRMATLAEQVAAPLAVLYSWGVFSALFLVPVAMKRSGVRPPSLKLGNRDQDDS